MKFQYILNNVVWSDTIYVIIKYNCWTFQMWQKKAMEIYG